MQRSRYFSTTAVGILLVATVANASYADDAPPEPAAAFAPRGDAATRLQLGDDGKVGAWIPIAWAEGVGRPDVSAPAVTYVAYRGGVLTRLAESFEPIAFRQVDSRKPALIGLFAPLDAFPEKLRAGQYRIVLDVNSPGIDRPPVVLSVEYPVSTFSAPADVAVKRTGVYDRFWVNTAQTPLKLTQTDGIAVDRDEVDLEVTWDGAKKGRLELTLSGSLPLEYGASIESGFAIGVHTGKVHVSGPSFPPFTVPLKLEHKAHAAVLGIVVALGIFLGIVVRGRIQAYIDRKHIGVRIALFDYRLKRAAARRQDREFVGQIGDLREQLARLAQAVDSGTAPQGLSGAETELAAITERFAAAVAKFDEKLQTALMRLNETIAAVAGERVLPATVLSVYNTAQAALVQVQGELLAGKGVNAAHARIEKLFAATQQVTSEWLNAFEDARGHILTIADGAVLPGPARQAWQSYTETLGALSPAPATISTPAQYGEALTAVETRYRETRQVVLRLQRDLVVAGQRVIGVAEQADQPPSTLGDLTKSVEAFSREDLGVFPVSETVERTGRFKASLHRVLDAMTATIIEPHGAKVPDTVSDNLANGYYVLAANEMLKLSAVKSMTFGALEPLAGEEPGDDGEPDTPANATSVLVEQSWTELSAEERALVFRTQAEIRRARWLQNTISAIGLIAVAYVIWLPEFDGSLRNVVALGLWGFALDVGVGSLVSQVRENVQPG